MQCDLSGMNTTIDSVLQRIARYAAAQGWTKRRFAAEAGLPDTTLRHLGKDCWNPQVETLRRLEAVIPRDFP